MGFKKYFSFGHSPNAKRKGVGLSVSSRIRLLTATGFPLQSLMRKTFGGCYKPWRYPYIKFSI